MRSDFHRPAFMIATRPAPFAVRSWVMPTLGECPENPSPSPASLHTRGDPDADGPAAPNTEYPGSRGRFLRADALQGRRRAHAHVKDSGRVGRLRAPDDHSGAPVPPELHVGPVQVGGFAASQQCVSHDRHDGDVHLPAPARGLGGLGAARRVHLWYVCSLDNGFQPFFTEPSGLPRLGLPRSAAQFLTPARVILTPSEAVGWEVRRGDGRS